MGGSSPTTIVRLRSTPADVTLLLLGSAIVIPEPCNIGFKEWSVICRALASGRQSLILRKGGIHEGSAGFQVAHRQFWLVPTHYHEAAQCVTEEGLGYLDAPGLGDGPAHFVVEHLAVVQRVQFLQDEAVLERLAGQHLWKLETLRQRFHYRQPGIFALLVRIYRGEPRDIGPESHFAGCKSWVEFEGALPTDRVVPVLADEAFAQAEQAALAAWSTIG